MEQGRYTLIMNMAGYIEIIPIEFSHGEFALISEILNWLRSGKFGSLEIIKVHSNNRDFIDIQITERKRFLND